MIHCFSRKEITYQLLLKIPNSSVLQFRHEQMWNKIKTSSTQTNSSRCDFNAAFSASMPALKERESVCEKWKNNHQFWDLKNNYISSLTNSWSTDENAIDFSNWPLLPDSLADFRGTFEKNKHNSMTTRSSNDYCENQIPEVHDLRCCSCHPLLPPSH